MAPKQGLRYKRGMRVRAKSGFLRGAVLQLVLLLATLAVAEVVLRIIDLRELRDGYNAGAPVVFQYDAELGWLPIPNHVSTFTGSRTITVRSNSFGLRDIEPEPEQPGRPTVMFIGDSYVWGYDVEANDRFTDLLRGEFPQVRIVNAGVNAYGTDNEYLLLRRYWNAFKPSVVVLIFCVDNDRMDNVTNDPWGYYKPYLAQAPDGEWKFFGQPVPASRHVYFVGNPIVRHLLLARAAVTGYVYFRYPKIIVPDPTERLMGMIRDFVAAGGGKFLVGLTRHEAALEAYLRAQAIPYISFDDAELYPLAGKHWTPAGHRLVADRMRAFLLENGALPAPVPPASGRN